MRNEGVVHHIILADIVRYSRSNILCCVTCMLHTNSTVLQTSHVTYELLAMYLYYLLYVTLREQNQQREVGL